MAAHVAASSPPDLLPSIPGLQYFPPLQSVRAKYCAFRSALSRNSRVDVPLNAYPYLCVSAEIEVTPGRVKSNTGMSRPRSRPNGRMNPPRHPSTCSPTPRSSASVERSVIGSIVP